GREVFAVPGEITSSLSAGTNALLRLGATPLTAPADVLESLGIEPPVPAPPHLSAVAASLLERLPAAVDELVRSSGLSAAEVAAARRGTTWGERPAATRPRRSSGGAQRARSTGWSQWRATRSAAPAACASPPMRRSAPRSSPNTRRCAATA